MPLALATPGEERVIREIRGKEEIKKHLLDLGFIVGEKVLVKGENASGLILSVKGVKLAMNRGLANKILVD